VAQGAWLRQVAVFEQETPELWKPSPAGEATGPISFDVEGKTNLNVPADPATAANNAGNPVANDNATPEMETVVETKVAA
jgi:hypothetical protein